MLTERQEKYLLKIPEDKVVKIVPHDPAIFSIVEGIKARLQGIVDLEVRFMGASALGISGQGDIDLYILCPETQYNNYIAKVESVFGARKAGISTNKWEFIEDGHEVEMYLTDPTTPSMREQIRVFELLQNHPDLRKEYELLKVAADGQSFREYMRRKYEFFNKVLA
jgi:GrpB-like predicted nucleotidyltransferase (UPF0157 family)